MKILSLDPASQTTGYAVLIAEDADEQPRLIESGRLRLPGRHDLDTRIDAMIDDLADLLDEHEPDHVLLETTSGKTSKRHKGGGAGLAIYGQAVGEFRRYLLCVNDGPLSQRGFDLECIKENDWTRGTSKVSRKAAVSMHYAGYDASQDPGYDASDAIYMAMWWRQRQQVEAMSK